MMLSSKEQSSSVVSSKLNKTSNMALLGSFLPCVSLRNSTFFPNIQAVFEGKRGKIARERALWVE